jgi:type I restriction enzyme M protein
MAITSKELGEILWKIANKQRGSLSPGDYKNYSLAFVFYKDISDQMENYANELLENDNIKYHELKEENKNELEVIREESLNKLGYFLYPWELYGQLLKKTETEEDSVQYPFILEKLKSTFKNIEESSFGRNSQDMFSNIFEKVDLNNSNLGETPEDKNKLIYQTMIELKDIELSESEGDVLGDAYEYLINKFASSGGTNKAGEYYTPQPVSKLLVNLMTTNKENINSIYDPTCGSGSLLLGFRRMLDYTPNFYGQELNGETFNLARMNMIMHNVPFNKCDIQRGNTLEQPKHLFLKFDRIIANPPYSAEWTRNPIFLQDERFSQYGVLAPQKYADFAFLQHMYYHLEDDGEMAVVLPHGVLFREGAEGKIRDFLIKEKNAIDTIIGLPENMFFGTSISTVIIVLKKCRKDTNNILFIDASNEFKKDGNKNKLTEVEINKITSTYKDRKDIDKYSKKIDINDIIDNGSNLNISRYVDTIEKEAEVDLSNISNKLNELNIKMGETSSIINNFCSELGIDSPIQK